VHGAAVGTIIGLCIAPQPGRRTREQLSAFGGAAKEGYGLARRTARQVAPFAGAAFSVVKSQLHRGKGEDVETDPEMAFDSNVRIHNETNGRH
jgi:gas vesicle protein